MTLSSLAATVAIDSGLLALIVLSVTIVVVIYLATAADRSLMGEEYQKGYDDGYQDATRRA